MSSSNGSPIRLALIGAGAWGRKLLWAFDRIAAARWVAVCDPDPNALAELPAGLRTYPHADALMADDGIDALVVASPPGWHHRHARAGLRAGKHVFVEKPLALERRHADELVELSERLERTLMVGHVLLFDPAVRWVREHAASSAMGHVHHVELVRVNLGRIRPDVGALWNLAPHDVAIANYWFGRSPVMARATGACVLRPDREDLAFVELDYPGQRRAHIHVSWLDAARRRSALLVGTRQVVSLRDHDGGVRVTVLEGGLAPSDVATPRERAELWGSLMAADAKRGWSPELPVCDPLATEAEHFVDCVRQRSRPLTDGRSGAAVVAALEAAHLDMKRMSDSTRVAVAS